MITVIQVILVWLPIAVTVAVALCIIYWYRTIRVSQPERWTQYLWRVVIGVVSFKLLMAVAIAGTQYYVWSNNTFTWLLVHQPLSDQSPSILTHIPFFTHHRLGYFMYYSIVRFLVPLLLAMLIAGVWTGFFVLLARYRPRLTVPGDLLLVFLTSFLVGWPGFVIFAPLTLLFAVVLSVRHQFVTLGLPSLLAAAAVLLFGGWLNSVLHLKVLAL